MTLKNLIVIDLNSSYDIITSESPQFKIAVLGYNIPH